MKLRPVVHYQSPDHMKMVNQRTGWTICIHGPHGCRYMIVRTVRVRSDCGIETHDTVAQAIYSTS